ncbi:MAG: UDP-N-acetylmuramoyl-L-alanine--D-glutamate ligase [Gemmatimonadota bacterium]|nr:UDP-N-acetylmuramoyl-L-alanine--D-glutamate ligase [Gemmatimonadota bacterium]
MNRTLAGETIGVLGLARSGEAAARLALAHGAGVYASDAGDTPAARAAAERVRVAGGDAEAGMHDLGRLAGCSGIVLSPGIPPTAPILQEPALAAVPRVGELEFAWRLLGVPTIAITGTNGKTTVTALAAHLLRAAGIDAAEGGNIGTALSEIALRDPSPAWAVVEASSFQLADTRAFSPEIGVVTNLSPDHLDRYPDVASYYADKGRLFRNATSQSRWILNGEDDAVLALAGDAPGTRLAFRVTGPLLEGELGGWIAADRLLTLRIRAGTDEPLVRTEELGILGEHNVANALAASLGARLAGAGPEAIAEGLRSFRAPPHRLEPVVERDGILWINDSKATNVASTRVALRSMQRPTVLLLGGKHKGECYTELLPDLRAHVRGVVAFGEASELVDRDLAPHVPVEQVRGPFEDAVRRAGEMARTGDVILLSPACSSFDMFANYEERGRRFAELAMQA